MTLLSITDDALFRFTLVAEQSKEISPQLRVKMVAAVAALAILGFLLAGMIWLGGRFTRKYINRPMVLMEKQDPEIDPDDWAK